MLYVGSESSGTTSVKVIQSGINSSVQILDPDATVHCGKQHSGIPVSKLSMIVTFSTKPLGVMLSLEEVILGQFPAC